MYGERRRDGIRGTVRCRWPHRGVKSTLNGIKLLAFVNALMAPSVGASAIVRAWLSVAAALISCFNWLSSRYCSGPVLQLDLINSSAFAEVPMVALAGRGIEMMKTDVNAVTINIFTTYLLCLVDITLLHKNLLKLNNSP